MCVCVCVCVVLLFFVSPFLLPLLIIICCCCLASCWLYSFVPKYNCSCIAYNSVLIACAVWPPPFQENVPSKDDFKALPGKLNPFRCSIHWPCVGPGGSVDMYMFMGVCARGSWLILCLCVWTCGRCTCVLVIIHNRGWLGPFWNGSACCLPALYACMYVCMMYVIRPCYCEEYLSRGVPCVFLITAKADAVRQR